MDVPSGGIMKCLRITSLPSSSVLVGVMVMQNGLIVVGSQKNVPWFPSYRFNLRLRRILKEDDKLQHVEWWNGGEVTRVETREYFDL